MKNQKTKKYSNLLKSFVFYKKHIKYFIGIVVVSIISSVLGILNPVFEGNILAEITIFNYEKIFFYIVLIVIVGVLLQLSNWIWFRLLIKLNKKVKIDIKGKLIRSLVYFETQNYDKSNSGVFVSRLNKDANELSTFYNAAIDCISGILSNFGFLIYIAFLNIWVFLFVLFEVVLMYFLENYRIKVFFKNRKKVKEADEIAIGGYSEIIRGVRDVKVLNMKRSSIKKAEVLQGEAISLSYKLDCQNDNIKRIINVTSVILSAAFIFMCIMLIKNELLLPATFFIVYIYTGKVRNLINFVVRMKQYMADGELSAERVFEVLGSDKFPKEKFGTINLENIQGKIEFKNVDFSYTEKNALFNDLSFVIPANKTVGIVGKSGQGKSTILSLIDKLYNIQAGEITIDGININELTEDALRDNVSIVMQNPYIFNVSVIENLRLVNEDATLEQIQEACKKAQIHDFIMELPEQYESTLGENGIVLSGGQKQRIAIARALLKNSKIILFDEATSALDNESQGKIKQAIDELSHDHTIVIVAHRLSTVVDCDKIMVVDENKIIMEGTHEELIKKCLPYQDLYKKEEQK